MRISVFVISNNFKKVLIYKEKKFLFEKKKIFFSLFNSHFYLHPEINKKIDLWWFNLSSRNHECSDERSLANFIFLINLSGKLWKFRRNRPFQIVHLRQKLKISNSKEINFICIIEMHSIDKNVYWSIKNNNRCQFFMRLLVDFFFFFEKNIFVA